MIIVVLGKQPFVRKSCSLITHSGTVTYMLGKCFMYLVFIVRLYVVYKNSMYRYEFRSIRIVAICTVTISFILILVVAFQIHPIHRQGEQYYLSECQAVLNVYIGALVVLYDLTLSIGSTIAFIKPLRHLIRCTQPLEDADQSSLIEIATKYAILTIVASITTFVLIIGSGLGLGSLTPLDLICNMICLVLMTRYYFRAHYWQWSGFGQFDAVGSHLQYDLLGALTRYYNEKKYYDVLCWIPIQCSSCCIWCCCAQPAPPVVTTLSTKLSNVRANSEANHAQIEQPKVRTELDQESNAPQQP
eukprot:CAMPEP_0197076608 /NCGR_PEP_ID=MMETSP1384-20130603/212203_1 /TAXON_ID=29189 /ORGANISM="Ammonia sp." /LENGTH=301 /DNA_ID=CAMNT_0042515467 /DNA_START=155 /DNA_END=1061 /DNA_ORIENTATION=-